MIIWIFSFIALGAAFAAATMLTIRRAILALWIAGLAMGGLYLTVGVETLAIIQWIISTLVAISFFFFAVLFGEYERESKDTTISPRKLLLSYAAVGSVGIGLAVAIYLGTSPLQLGTDHLPAKANDLASVGKVMAENHIIALEVLGLTLFLILVGGGVVARPESPKQGESTETGGEPC